MATANGVEAGYHVGPKARSCGSDRRAEKAEKDGGSMVGELSEGINDPKTCIGMAKTE
jgi:hypothetical protein